MHRRECFNGMNVGKRGIKKLTLYDERVEFEV
jgi:hypothetical protein